MGKRRHEKYVGHTSSHGWALVPPKPNRWARAQNSERLVAAGRTVLRLILDRDGHPVESLTVARRVDGQYQGANLVRGTKEALLI
jgi:hypothetical protein